MSTTVVVRIIAVRNVVRSLHIDLHTKAAILNRWRTEAHVIWIVELHIDSLLVQSE